MSGKHRGNVGVGQRSKPVGKSLSLGYTIPKRGPSFDDFLMSLGQTSKNKVASQRKIRRGSTDCSPRSDTSSASSTSPGIPTVVAVKVVDKRDARSASSASKHRKSFGSSQSSSSSSSNVHNRNKSHRPSSSSSTATTSAKSECKRSHSTSHPKAITDVDRKSDVRDRTTEKTSSKRSRSRSSDRHASSQSKRHRSSHHSKRDASPRRRDSGTNIIRKSAENVKAKIATVPESVVEPPKSGLSANEKKKLSKSQPEQLTRKKASSEKKIESGCSKKPDRKVAADDDRNIVKAVRSLESVPPVGKVDPQSQVISVQPATQAPSFPAPSTQQSRTDAEADIEDDDDDDVNYEYDEEGLKQLELRLLHLYRHRQPPQPEVTAKPKDDPTPWLRPLDLNDIFRPPPMLRPFDVIGVEDILAFKGLKVFEPPAMLSDIEDDDGEEKLLPMDKKTEVVATEPSMSASLTTLWTDVAPSPMRKRQLASLTSSKEDYIPPTRNVDVVDDVDDDDDRLYCICKSRNDISRPMVQCEECEDWYHFMCVAYFPTQHEEDEPYICPMCKK